VATTPTELIGVAHVDTAVVYEQIRRTVLETLDDVRRR
jgi:hypothetical protein